MRHMISLRYLYFKRSMCALYILTKYNRKEIGPNRTIVLVRVTVCHEKDLEGTNV